MAASLRPTGKMNHRPRLPALDLSSGRYRAAWRTMTRCLAAGCVAVAALVCAVHEARAADRISQLIGLLRKDSSYKVRLQAVIGLGRHKDRRAVDALVRVGLADESDSVRAMAATALGRIGDRRALGPLASAQKRERHPFARTQIAKAIAALQQQGGGAVQIPSGARFLITVGKIGNNTAQGGAQLSRALADALLKEFGQVSGVATAPAGSQPDAGMLRKRRIKAFVLDGAILSASQRPAGGAVEISCSIKVSLATYPQNSMKAFYSGGAAMQVSAQEARSGNAVSLFKEVLAGAATGAREQIVSSYLSAQ